MKIRKRLKQYGNFKTDQGRKLTMFFKTNNIEDGFGVLYVVPFRS